MDYLGFIYDLSDKMKDALAAIKAISDKLILFVTE